MASRLVDASVLDVDGFALNTSNFQFNQNLAHYGRWVSSCVEYGANVNPGHFDACPDQYGSEDGTALSPFGKWSDSASKAKFNTSAENGRYAELLGSSDSSVHFVIDSSRNGLGPWAGTAAHPASRGNTETWCNPPDRGAGKRPTANTGAVLLDAYLWVKVPGESDGRCFRWTNGPNDPVRHRRDPSAGAWFGEQALEFARLAAPAFH